MILARARLAAAAALDFAAADEIYIASDTVGAWEGVGSC